MVGSLSLVTSQGQGDSLRMVLDEPKTVSENSSWDMIKRIFWINVIYYIFSSDLLRFISEL